MWRSFFLSIGIFAMAFGLQCLGVEKMVLKAKGPLPAKTSLWDNVPKIAPNKEFSPPNWAPWSLLSSGAVICLYSFTIPKRMSG